MHVTFHTRTLHVKSCTPHTHRYALHTPIHAHTRTKHTCTRSYTHDTHLYTHFRRPHTQLPRHTRSVHVKTLIHARHTRICTHILHARHTHIHARNTLMHARISKSQRDVTLDFLAIYPPFRRHARVTLLFFQNLPPPPCHA